MGTSVTATAMLGVKISVDVIEHKTQVRGCKHNETKNKFCSECGEETWKIEVEYDDHPIHEVTDCISVSDPFVHQFSYDGNEVWFGVGDQIDPKYDDKESTAFGLPDIENIREQIKSVLEPIGCWDKKVESTFGWHLIVNWS